MLFRSRVIPLFIPPLRERPGDVRLLSEKIIEELNGPPSDKGGRRHIAQISPAALERLQRYDFPGNVRELRNILAYAFVIGDGPILTPGDLPPELLSLGESNAVTQEGAPASDTPRVALSPEAARIATVLQRAGGNRERAARVLGMSRVTLWRRMRELGLAPPRRG